MKTKLSILLVAMIAAVAAFGGDANTNRGDNLDLFTYPITGTTVTDLDSAFKEIRSMIPVGPRIIGIRVQDERHITVQTGKVAGALAGAGKWMFFEKSDGKWKKTKEIDWVS